MPYTPRIVLSVSAIVLASVLSACTVKLAAPEKPITINLNVKIEHEVRVKVEKDLDNLFEENDALF
ncbi:MULTISPECIES: YnbE family lipoprotein [unclassified Oceanobacter]|uniref:YnbE family lipoprotein n=1 Tax=unclassified Oceanobacter TaxID=2620260 RepID=UPI0026E419BC|nr:MULTISPECIES: YnbE family lipoprotein [unclassified Oceanobacter]MDO6682139.1 YnbE family lipoprotein [Oceanobacter sp. 5_MG-2023]MDP2505465.1 YnbE family lipoprotein [Oceanobacter sp. 3_MG-2023]MDP2548610.1 YnbE family lipoprotein [Oceanobacter sp. 4_MG-2023]MDP2610369.1 YnbE family lipoprotein [Oceanobacter sp. 1_MG-2023]MDP2613621.1 YnbE family lipoprotein [Oceanobacter sp. 2_MG-2023]